MKKIILPVILIGLLLPLLSFANYYMTNEGRVYYDGLVPCGRELSIDGGSTLEFIPCGFCHLFVMLNGILNFVLFDLIPPLAVLMLVIAGITYITHYFWGTVSPEALGQSKKIITAVFIGLIIIYAAWLFINLFFTIIGLADWTGLRENWFLINCPINI